MKKEKKLNSRGFTLIEVLAVIVILLIIVGIAIPNISASLDRQTCKTTEAKAKLIESAAQFYVSDNRNSIRSTLATLPAADANEIKSCKINIDKISDLTSDDKIDGNGNSIKGYVIYKTDETYTFCFNEGNDICSLNPKGDDDNPICDEDLDECVPSTPE